RPLADLDPELEQLAADALGAPQSAPRRHVADSVDRLTRQRRRFARPGSAPPEQAEAGAMPTQNGLRLDDGDRATPRRQHARATRSFNRSTRWSVGRLLRRRRTLTWWRRTAFSMISSRRDRTASTATPAISLAHLCWASCDHSRPTQPTTQVRIRVTLGNRIPTWSMNEVAGGTDGIAQLPPWPHSDPQ